MEDVEAVALAGGQVEDKLIPAISFCKPNEFDMSRHFLPLLPGIVRVVELWRGREGGEGERGEGLEGERGEGEERGRARERNIKSGL